MRWRRIPNPPGLPDRTQGDRRPAGIALQTDTQRTLDSLHLVQADIAQLGVAHAQVTQAEHEKVLAGVAVGRLAFPLALGDVPSGRSAGVEELHDDVGVGVVLIGVQGRQGLLDCLREQLHVLAPFSRLTDKLSIAQSSTVRKGYFTSPRPAAERRYPLAPQRAEHPRAYEPRPPERTGR